VERTTEGKTKRSLILGLGNRHGKYRVRKLKILD